MEEKESNTGGITVQPKKLEFEIIEDTYLNLINQSYEKCKFPDK